jgi:hypothetical protein
MSPSDYAINNHLTPFISMQNYHSLLYREEEREMLPVCKVYLLLDLLDTCLNPLALWRRNYSLVSSLPRSSRSPS